MIKFYQNIIPPQKWRIPVLILSGIFIGLIFFLLKISKAGSYISDKPATCVNCHIMAPQFATWQHSAHREYATCNDCHVPHNNIVNKYYFKAKDGIRHGSIFTMRAEPQVIFIKNAGKKVVQQNCIRCHTNVITDIKLLQSTTQYLHHKKDRICWECHRETPHGRVNSLSSVPNARVPLPETPVPEWLKKIIKENN